jgi:hypothetical protein
VRQPPPAHRRIALGVLLVVLVSVIAYTLAPIVGQERETLLAGERRSFWKRAATGATGSGTWEHQLGPTCPAWDWAIGKAISGAGWDHRRKSRRPGQRMPELEPAERDVSHLLRHMPTPRLNEAETEALAMYLASLK